MKLIIFDIDGTILDSVNADDDCFIQTFRDLYEIDLSNGNWNDFEHVTDLGLTREIFQKQLKRLPNEQDISRTKTHFKNLLEKRMHEFTEINGALDFIRFLSEKNDIELGFATGGWKETAELKCTSIGLNLNDFIFKSSNDHFDRANIIQQVATTASNKHSNRFDSITYFGDGLWDYKTTQQLGIDFIGVDVKNNDRLKNAGALNVLSDYSDPEKILTLI